MKAAAALIMLAVAAPAPVGVQTMSPIFDRYAARQIVDTLIDAIQRGEDQDTIELIIGEILGRMLWSQPTEGA